jgi:hypothetical protein
VAHALKSAVSALMRTLWFKDPGVAMSGDAARKEKECVRHMCIEPHGRITAKWLFPITDIES